MKKMIILVGLFSAFIVKAETYQRTAVQSINLQDDMYASFEVVTNKYEKVILDCQGFIHGLRFYENKKLIREIRMVDYYTCDNVQAFIEQSLSSNKEVCLEVEEKSNSLNLSNAAASECQ